MSEENTPYEIVGSHVFLQPYAAEKLLSACKPHDIRGYRTFHATNENSSSETPFTSFFPEHL
jgi:hypothetical protein